jgi:hypothetical protein
MEAVLDKHWLRRLAIIGVAALMLTLGLIGFGTVYWIFIHR